jgi:hypothetical protein
MTYFYGHLFAIAPGFRGLFPASMHAQRQRLYSALRAMASRADPDSAAGDGVLDDDPARGHPGQAGAAKGHPVAGDAVTDGPAKDEPAKDGTDRDRSDKDGGGEDDAAKDSADEQALAALGRAHRKFGVRPEHYAPFRAALLATGRHFARGEPDAARAEAALAAAFDRAAAIMIAAARADSAIAPAWWTAEVTRHEAAAPDVAVLTVKPDEPLRYLPGQHVPVQTPRWPRQWRSYSIVNAPRPDGTLTLRVRAVPGGQVSAALVYRTRPGDILLLGAPEGPGAA